MLFKIEIGTMLGEIFSPGIFSRRNMQTALLKQKLEW